MLHIITTIHICSFNLILNLTAGGVNNVRDGVGRGEQGGRGGEERHLPRHQAHHAHCSHPSLHPLRYGGILATVTIMLMVTFSGDCDPVCIFISDQAASSSDGS